MLFDLSEFVYGPFWRYQIEDSLWAQVCSVVTKLKRLSIPQMRRFQPYVQVLITRTEILGAFALHKEEARWGAKHSPLFWNVCTHIDSICDAECVKYHKNLHSVHGLKSTVSQNLWLHRALLLPMSILASVYISIRSRACLGHFMVEAP